MTVRLEGCGDRGRHLQAGKMYNSSPGSSLNADTLCWKFFAITSFGTWASQSVIKNVPSSSKFPVSNTYRGNSRSESIIYPPHVTLRISLTYQQKFCAVVCCIRSLQ